MTERRAGSIETRSNSLSIGPSHVRFEDGALTFEINERSAPLFRPLRGTVVIRPEIEQDQTFILDQHQRHVWRPVWPRAHVEARFEDPDFKMDGDGYVDMNAGSEPLEAGFKSWNWARTSTREGAAIVYDSHWKEGGGSSLALNINKDGRAEPFEMPSAHPLPQTVWRVPREARSDAPPQLTRTLEDTPFYTRSLIETDMLGQRCQVMHESLDLKRFSSNWVKCLLPFRMPRELG